MSMNTYSLYTIPNGLKSPKDPVSLCEVEHQVIARLSAHPARNPHDFPDNATPVPVYKTAFIFMS